MTSLYINIKIDKLGNIYNRIIESFIIVHFFNFFVIKLANLLLWLYLLRAYSVVITISILLGWYIIYFL